ncbi:unnamed protein product [Paramecium sonneborni]|uniref:Uncharacterized protein n=1 Tax=Paramecium sonneborni TaxID=65129 RepID=A0A8S1QFF3_9CILI|nr:unnamed protein product [Paramecium sonneborni]
MQNKNGTYTKSKYSSSMSVQSVDNRVRYSQAPEELGKRARLPLDITVFVMAVEVERLQRENTQLKSDLQYNSDSNLDRVQYESQIRDLMEKIRVQNNSQSTLLIDIEKLQRQVQDLEDQLRRQQQSQKEFDPNWRTKLSQAELQLAAFQKQLNQQVNLFGGQSADQVMRELEELRRKKLQFEDLSRQMNGKNVNELLREIEELRRKQMSVEDTSVLRQQLLQSQNRERQLQQKLTEMDSYVSTLESDLNRFESENKRLTISMSSKIQTENNEAILLRNEITKLNNEISKLWSDNETLVLEIDSLQMKLRTLSEDELRRLRNELNRLQEQNNLLESQMIRLQSQNQSLMSEISQLNMTIEQNQYAINDANKQKYIFEEYKEKIRQFELKFQELQLQNERLRQQDHKVAILTTEIERLNNLIKQLNIDADEWKQKYQRIELTLMDYRQIEKTNRDAASKNESLLDEIERLKKILEQKQYDMDQLIKQYDVIQTQISTYQINANSNVSRIQEYESNQSKTTVIVQENERLKRQLQQHQQQMSVLQTQVQEQTQKNQQLITQQQQSFAMNNNSAEIDKLKGQIHEYENKIAMLSLELSRVRNSKQNTNSYDKSDKVMELLTIIAMMSAELDNLRGITYDKSTVQSQRLQDNTSQSIRSQSINNQQANYSYSSWKQK